MISGNWRFTMSTNITFVNVVKVVVSGKLSVTDQVEIKNHTMNHVAKNGPVRVLVAIKDFEGWTKDEKWDDFTLQVADENILKMAIVANEQFRDRALMFVGKGFRSFPIDFFPDGQLRDAHDWLLK